MCFRFARVWSVTVVLLAAPSCALDGSGLGTAGLGGATADGGTGGDGGPCSPSTCPDGCCDQSRCVTQRSVGFCGVAGAACQPCGECQMCASGGTCAIDPESRWTIVCAAAQLSAMRASGGPWDDSGGMGNRNPDPFCEFETVGGVIDTGAGVTATVRDSFTAAWAETVTPPGVTISAATLMSATASWRLWVGDDDGCGANGCVADLACEIAAPMQSTWLASGGFTLMNLQSCVSVGVKLVCQP